MAQVSIGQVENLEDLVRDLQSVREALEAACREQIAVAEQKCAEAREEAQNSASMLESAIQQEQAATQNVDGAEQALDSSQSSLSSAESALSACLAQPHDDDGRCPDCSGEDSAVAEAEAAVEQAQSMLEQARAELEVAKGDRISMEQRVDLANQAEAMAEHTLEQTLQACNAHLATVDQAIEAGTARLISAQQALDAYLATNPSAAQFHAWLKWDPAKDGRPVTPDMLRDRMNLSSEQRRLLQEYLYDRDPAYRKQVDKFRNQWVAAKGDAERNIVARKARIHLSGEFGEQIVRHALAPLGGRIETQGRTFVGDNGRYTKTDLIVTDLRVPVILGRGEGMGAPVGGSMAFEVKCGKAEYLYSQKDHMIFQAEGHKQAGAQCTLCSRDIHDLPEEKQKELRDALREAGSPMVGMLPRKNEIDQSCLDFIRQNEEEQP
ncbi:hypothetical protein OFL75_25800 [Pseudomonas aeruginosa]|uniref:Uncharacterized protein n=1 Tax=Pseudomonas aeruginosa TaxID=287 RepID=A0A2C9X1E7_PSEAI|nr:MULTISPECIES: hypothetical protein [Pseudomonas]MCB2256302.1 hypothetical protein [Pseudomonas chlororaphis]MCD2790761.1 hypothetical protein [Pseudomonas aeruginosa]MCD2850638.1 hypothetical protein [Pseudomonas aeruginosa]MCD2864761.1 hypothetical protein [Pseudomonas aeruginosa]MCV6106087.1 hypothetical protein [Pseudomonas aeruginosa]